MKKRVLIPLAEGAEEMETVILVDVLRRGGLEVILAGVRGADAVECSRGVKLIPDCALSEIDGDFDLVVLPGGAGGAKALAASEEVKSILKKQDQAGRLVGAICAAPIALVAAEVGKGKLMTSHPAVKEEISAFGTYSEDRVVVDGNVATSRGPGTTFEFALKLLEKLEGIKRAQAVAGPMILPG